MGKSIVAEKCADHYAIQINPLWRMFAPLARNVPAGGGVRFFAATNVATQTQAHGNFLFINCSIAKDTPGIFQVHPLEYDRDHKVDHGYAVYHGHMGIITTPSNKRIDAAINCGQTAKPDTHCTSELLDKIAECAKKWWNSPDSSELQITQFMGGLVVGVVHGAWEVGKGLFMLGYGIGEHLGKASELGRQDSPILSTLIPGYDVARGEVMMAEALKKKFDEATKGLSREEINGAMDAWLIETLVKGGCAAAKALGDALNDPKNSAPYNGGKVVGKVVFDVVVAIETAGAATEAKAGAGAAKSEGLIDSLLEKFRTAKEPKKIEPDPHPKPPKNEPPPAEEPHSGSTPGKPKTLEDCIACLRHAGTGPVNPVLGAKFLSDEDELDFSLPGILPLEWQRTYCSSNANVGWLGQGWSLPFEVHLKSNKDGIDLIDPYGRAIPFFHLAPGRSQYQHTAQITLARSEDGQVYRLISPDGSVTTFAMAERPGIYRLTRTQDRDGNAIALEYDGAFPITITGSGGQVLRLTFANNRLQEIIEYKADRTQEVWVSYRHNTNGDLIGVLDGEGKYRRRFGWKNHMMTAHWNAAGFETKYVYDHYIPEGKVVVHSNNLGGHWTFDYQAGETVVTDVLKRVNRYRFDGKRRWTGLIYPDGSAVQRELDPFGHLQSLTNALGRKTEYVRDDHGNPTHIQRPDGSSIGIVWNRRWQQPSQIIYPDGGTERFLFDERGHIVTYIGLDDDITRTEYNTQGLPVRIIDANGGVVTLGWDYLGNLIRYTDCSGKVTSYVYEQDMLKEIIDALGQVTRYHYNTMRQLVATHRADGKMEQYQYDAIGRFVAYTDAQGQVTRYELEPDGLPKEKRDVLGYSLRYEYDLARRLTTLINENNVPHRFGYDSVDRLIEEIGFDGLATSYRFNLGGELTERVEGINTVTPIVTCYRRDVMGRLTEKYSQGRHADGRDDSDSRLRTRFGYNVLGQMIEARNKHSKLEMRYDGAKRLIEETTTALGQRRTLRHVWSPLGHRTQTVLPDGKVLNYLTYGSGHLHQINIDGVLISDIERDDLHREVSRTQGALASEFAYDPMGRLLQQQVRHQKISEQSIDPQAAGGAKSMPNIILFGQESLAGLTRHYQYDNLGQLLVLADSRRGARGYRYDGAGQLLIAQQPGLKETFSFDPAHNLLDPAQSASGNPDNRLRVFGENRYTYDPLGRLAQKSSPKRTLELRWNNDGQLTQSISRTHALKSPASDGQTGHSIITCYAYDAFGRRIAKWNRPNKHRRTEPLTKIHYAWDGNRLLEEDNCGTVHTYVYLPRSFRLIAQVSRPSGSPLASPFEDETDPHEAFDAQLQILLNDRTQPAEVRRALREALGEQAIRDKCGIEGIQLKAAQTKGKSPATEAMLTVQESPEGTYHIGQDPLQWAALHPAKIIDIGGITFQALNPPPESPATPKSSVENHIDHTAGYDIGDDPLDWEPLRLPKVIEQQGMVSIQPRSTGNVKIFHYHTDHLGTPQEVTDEAGVILWQALYKAWGQMIPQVTNDNTDIRTLTTAQLQVRDSQMRVGQDFHQPIRFLGQYEDDETGLHYNRFRYYDPECGRFVSQDPIGLLGGNNFYQYAPNPVNWSDPLGLVYIPSSSTNNGEGYAIYAICDKGDVGYIGQTDDFDRRVGEHVKEKGVKAENVIQIDQAKNYGEARGYEQAHIEKHDTLGEAKRGKWGCPCGPGNIGNKKVGFDTASKTRDAARQKSFMDAYTQKMDLLKQLGTNPCAGKG